MGKRTGESGETEGKGEEDVMVYCPKCKAKGSDIVFNEVWDGAHMEFTQNDDGTINPEGVVLDKSDPVQVRGFCLKCTHRWTIRGIRQVVNLPGHPDFGKFS